MEESCIEVTKLEFLTIATSTGNYQDNDIQYGFH